MASTLKEIAVSLSRKQQHYVNNLTDESPILDNMKFEPSTHGLWNAYEEVSRIEGAGFVDINQPLPEMEVDSNLKKIDLSILYSKVGDYHTALKLDYEVLEVRKRILGEEHPDTLDAMHNLVISYREMEDYQAALKLAEELLEARKRNLGEEHPDTLSTKHHFAIINS